MNVLWEGFLTQSSDGLSYDTDIFIDNDKKNYHKGL
jgi:hypothetical protein